MLIKVQTKSVSSSRMFSLLGDEWVRCMGREGLSQIWMRLLHRFALVSLKGELSHFISRVHIPCLATMISKSKNRPLQLGLLKSAHYSQI
jgi:hypothetical protein